MRFVLPELGKSSLPSLSCDVSRSLSIEPTYKRGKDTTNIMKSHELERIADLANKGRDVWVIVRPILVVEVARVDQDPVDAKLRDQYNREIIDWLDRRSLRITLKGGQRWTWHSVYMEMLKDVGLGIQRGLIGDAEIIAE